MFERGTLSFRFRVARLHELSFSYKETLEQGKKSECTSRDWINF